MSTTSDAVDVIEKQKMIVLKEMMQSWSQADAYLQGYFLGTLRGLQEAVRLLKAQDAQAWVAALEHDNPT